MAVGGDDAFQRLQADIGTEAHQSVVDILHIGSIGNVEGQLHDNTPCIDVMVQEKSGDACASLTIDDCPIDGSSATILRQQCRMHVERAVSRHGPHHLGQHSESHHHLQVGLISTQLLHKLRVFHLLWLQHGQAMLHGILLDGRRLQHRAMPPHWLVGLSHHCHHVISILHHCPKRLHRKLRRSHKHNSKIFFLHFCIILYSLGKPAISPHSCRVPSCGTRYRAAVARCNLSVACQYRLRATTQLPSVRMFSSR